MNARLLSSPASKAGDGAVRRRFPISAPGATMLLDLLIAQDGSTTRLCETLAGARVHVQVHGQAQTADVPAQVRECLQGDGFIERITSLVVDGEVLTDNLVYVALEGLDPMLRSRLQAGTLPIGHLVTQRWLRREPLGATPDLLARLWRVVGEPDPAAMRCYRMLLLDGPALIVCETFRRGLWQPFARALGRAPAGALA